MIGRNLNMRIVYMGTPDFAVPALETLIASKHEIVAVVTQPDKPKGRGKAVQFTPVKEIALEHNIALYQPIKVRDPEFIEILKEINPDVIVVVAFGQMLPRAILDLPKYGCVNAHGSLLPKYRGAAPMQWSIIDGEAETGVTTMFMDVGCDTGDMLEKAVIPIDPKETLATLHDKLAALNGPLLLSTLDKLEDGTIVRTKQEDEKSCYAKMLTKELGKIDWSQPAVVIERLIRGLNPWPSAYSSLHGKTLKVWDADIIGENSGRKPGEIVQITKTSLNVQTGDGILAIKEVQLEGKKRMSVDAFLRGYSVQQDDVLI